jgi:hypothetical protein
MKRAFSAVYRGPAIYDNQDRYDERLQQLVELVKFGIRP